MSTEKQKSEKNNSDILEACISFSGLFSHFLLLLNLISVETRNLLRIASLNL